MFKHILYNKNILLGFKASGELFGQKNTSMVEKTGSDLFGSSNPNNSFGQSQPIGIEFSFVKPTTQPSNIFNTSITSIAGTGVNGASANGNTYKWSLV